MSRRGATVSRSASASAAWSEEPLETISRSALKASRTASGSTASRRSCVGTRKVVVAPSRAMIAARSGILCGGGASTTVPPAVR